MSIGGIGGYNAFAQPLIQERTSNNAARNSDEDAKGSVAVSKREEVFRSLLTASNEAETTDKAGSSERGVSATRGKLVDLSV